jgi:hypothetical protein
MQKNRMASLLPTTLGVKDVPLAYANDTVPNDELVSDP